LAMHYELYLLSIAPKIPAIWLERAVETIVLGLLSGDRYLKIAGKALVQFKVWEFLSNRKAFEKAMSAFRSDSTSTNQHIDGIFDKIKEEIKIEDGEDNG